MSQGSHGRNRAELEHWRAIFHPHSWLSLYSLNPSPHGRTWQPTASVLYELDFYSPASQGQCISQFQHASAKDLGADLSQESISGPISYGQSETGPHSITWLLLSKDGVRLGGIILQKGGEGIGWSNKVSKLPENEKLKNIPRSKLRIYLWASWEPKLRRNMNGLQSSNQLIKRGGADNRREKHFLLLNLLKRFFMEGKLRNMMDDSSATI